MREKHFTHAQRKPRTTIYFKRVIGPTPDGVGSEESNSVLDSSSAIMGRHYKLEGGHLSPQESPAMQKRYIKIMPIASKFLNLPWLHEKRGCAVVFGQSPRDINLIGGVKNTERKLDATALSYNITRTYLESMVKMLHNQAKNLHMSLKLPGGR